MPGSNEVPQGEAKGRWQCPQREAREVSMRPDYEVHISFIETFHEGLPQDGIGCPDAFPVELKLEMLHLGNFLATKSRR